MIYSILLVTLFVSAILRSILFYIVSMRASRGMHDSMFDSIVHTPMQFFSWNPAGRILNRYATGGTFMSLKLPESEINVKY